MTPTFNSEKIKFFVLFLGFSALLGVLIPLATFGATIFEEDFEEYSSGTQLGGQGGWSCAYNNFYVFGWGAYHGTNKLETGNYIVSQCQKTGAEVVEGQVEFWVKSQNCGKGTGRSEEGEVIFRPDASNSTFSFLFNSWGGAPDKCFVRFNGDKNGSHYTNEEMSFFNNWVRVQFQWKKEALVSYFRYRLGDYALTEWYEANFNFDFVDRVVLIASWGEGGNAIDFDFINEPEITPPPPPAFRVWGISPVSGTEITSTSTEFSFGWEGLATSSTSYYQGFWLNFREKITGVKTEGYLFVTAEPSGTATTSLENFNFDKNSDYYLTAIGAGYTFGYYTDLVSPEFYYTINVAGLGEIFKMTDFSTWYAENSVFATPTPIFISLTGFLEPVFSKVGEFGERITNFFDLDDAYTRGYDIGIIFPTFGQYIDEIEVFMGGFPLIKLFLISLLVLLGIFIIKLILKFIPFFG